MGNVKYGLCFPYSGVNGIDQQDQPKHKAKSEGSSSLPRVHPRCGLPMGVTRIPNPMMRNREPCPPQATDAKKHEKKSGQHLAEAAPIRCALAEKNEGQHQKNR